MSRSNAAMLQLRCSAMTRRASQNSGSRDTLVLCPAIVTERFTGPVADADAGDIQAISSRMRECCGRQPLSCMNRCPLICWSSAGPAAQAPCSGDRVSDRPDHRRRRQSQAFVDHGCDVSHPDAGFGGHIVGVGGEGALERDAVSRCNVLVMHHRPAGVFRAPDFGCAVFACRVE